MKRLSGIVAGIPTTVAIALLVSACGGADHLAALPDVVAAPSAIAAPVGDVPAPPGPLSVPGVPKARVERIAEPTRPAVVPGRAGRPVAAPAAPRAVPAAPQPARTEANREASDVGVTKDSIRLGSITMHGMALAGLVTAPTVRGNLATAAAINDRGGVLGRRLQVVDCDDGAGEIARARACIQRFVTQDRVFSLITGVDWATSAMHSDLAEHRLPYVGSWAYSQTEWQDPYMFPTHMSMLHEALAAASWVRDVVQPKTYGLICLAAAEMQLACAQAKRILDASGAKLVRKLDVSLAEFTTSAPVVAMRGETSMAAPMLAMRAANPDHILHFVVNPSTMVKFMVEADKQRYYPPRGISGNHLAAEALGSLFGRWPAGRYWTVAPYRLWGSEFVATMTRYARGNRGLNHHVVQAGYVGLNVFARAAKEVGPDLTRERLMATLGNGTVWQADASLDQRFSYVAGERHGNNWNSGLGQGRAYMYRYDAVNTVTNPDGSPNGWTPDPDQFVVTATP